MAYNAKYVKKADGTLPGTSLVEQTELFLDEVGRLAEGATVEAGRAADAAEVAAGAALRAESAATEAEAGVAAIGVRVEDIAHKAAEAGDKATTALAAAGHATNQSAEAGSRATEALETARNAASTASTALSRADDAVRSGQEARKDALQARETAEQADGKAEQALAGVGRAVVYWNEYTTYTLPSLVFGDDDEIYRAVQESGPDTEAGARNPVEDKAYWKPVGSGGGYLLCEFYAFRHPTLRAGFAAADGTVIESADELFPEAWEFLQTEEGGRLCVGMEEWIAMSESEPWLGVGGVPYYALDPEAKILRLPDVRGMYMEAAGFDDLDVGGVHGDAIRNIKGELTVGWACNFSPNQTGLFTTSGGGASAGGGIAYHNANLATFDASVVVPTANKNQPRAWGANWCVYLGGVGSPGAGMDQAWSDIRSMRVEATTLEEDQPATAFFDKQRNTLSIGIPKGERGADTWHDDKDYPVPSLVFGEDNALYQAVAESGPNTNAGARNPVEDEDCWRAVSSASANSPSSGGGYELCEFYAFRHPTVRKGFALADGSVIEEADKLHPEAWAYLQSEDGGKLCVTAEEWQAMSEADPWVGVGGVAFYALNLEEKSLRLPDLRGMYMEAAGLDDLDVGGVHGDAIRNIRGDLSIGLGANFSPGQAGIFTTSGRGSSIDGGILSYHSAGLATFDASRAVPTANKNQPRAWGANWCVYLGGAEGNNGVGFSGIFRKEIFTSSGQWVAPRNGQYRITCIGGGGGGGKGGGYSNNGNGGTQGGTTSFGSLLSAMGGSGGGGGGASGGGGGGGCGNTEVLRIEVLAGEHIPIIIGGGGLGAISGNTDLTNNEGDGEGPYGGKGGISSMGGDGRRKIRRKR